MWTVIWTLLAFVLLLFHGDSILAFAAEQLRARRAHQLQVERERTRQALIGRQGDALVWNQLDATDPGQDAPADRALAAHGTFPPRLSTTASGRHHSELTFG